MKTAPGIQLQYFDFLRGWAALLVFLHHAALLGGGPGFLGNGHVGEEAVNAFMFASGFLIYYQSAINTDYAGFADRRGVANFYIRRFFRIAPVYYLALAVALLAGPWLGEARQAIAGVVGSSQTDLSRYAPADLATNAAMHLSFLFGLFPAYAFSTPLPDWSLGLEMQFYLLFPLMFVLLRRDFLWALLGLLAAFLAVRTGLKLAGVAYPMPSFLPLKFHNFAAGMAIAHLYLNPGVKRLPLLAAVLLFVTVGERSAWMPAMVLFSLAVLTLPPGHGPLGRIFGHWTSRWLAELSYSVYILHLLLLLPFFAWAVRYTSVSAGWWWLAVAALLAAVLLLSWCVLHVVEKPGIALGKRLLQRPHRPRSEALPLAAD